MSRRMLTAAGVTVTVMLALSPHAAAAAPAQSADAEVTVVAATLDPADARSRATERVRAMTLPEKAASVVMGHIPTTDAATAASYMVANGLGGFILMGANVPRDEPALRALTAALTPDPRFPPLLAIDQEGGDVSRLPWDAFPAARTLKDAPADAVRDAFAGRGALVDRAGIGVNFGVVADVTGDRSMFIFRRALGVDPVGAAERVAAAVAGEGGQVASTLKHFPGHGAAPGDSHAGIPETAMTRDQWRATDAAPFLAGIDAGAPLLMFGHLRYTAVDSAPASLSAEWHRIAREELGFEGVAVTDDLGMLQASGEPALADPVANAVSALAAGNDLVLSVMFTDAGSASRLVEGIVAAVESGVLPAERLDEAATRVAELRLAQADAGSSLVPCAECAPAG
ncbi:glycoside hydrolase family 3 N-terminal domain-containing protein [Microbacterium sp. RD1]|uniref:glycoside hydrolase family 3 N-terminal domain-containing protein n=1 Tax=Microbacterium sp. RD1 TaxID=3457313 RepID=UPI003FA56343